MTNFGYITQSPEKLAVVLSTVRECKEKEDCTACPLKTCEQCYMYREVLKWLYEDKTNDQ